MIVVIGSSNTDMIVKVPDIPAPGETILGGEFTTASGGKGANQAVAAARCGGQVKFVANVGRDSFGKQAIENFQADGIDTTHVFEDADAPSGIALIMVSEAGENSIAVALGANDHLNPAAINQLEATISQATILLIQLEIPLATVEKAVDIAHKHGVKVILNPAPAQALSDELLSKVSIITPNESEAMLLTGIEVIGGDSAIESGRALIQRGVDTAIITLGSEGAMIVTADSQQKVPTYPVKAVDTTAAGDTFNGALAVALSEGMALPDAVQFANAAAALSVTRMGAQPSVPQRREVETLLNNQS